MYLFVLSSMFVSCGESEAEIKEQQEKKEQQKKEVEQTTDDLFDDLDKELSEDEAEG